MGCLNSKKEIQDEHPNLFRVANINDIGAEFSSGHIEVTDSNILLYREGRETTKWPLHALRRYGFEGEIFSFESGRRCDTGEGIYAFRCKRAPLLFTNLQTQIQLKNVVNESSAFPTSHLTTSPQGRQTLQASVVHRSSIDNGQPDNLRLSMNNNFSNIPLIPRNISQTPRSHSSVEILEVMPLYPRNRNNTNHASNVYQLREFKREHNNNQGESVPDLGHVYSNDLSRDLAILRNTLKQETAMNTMREIEDETRFLQSRYVNEVCNNPKSPLSPTQSTSSEHYAQLSLEQQELARLYMNIAPEKGGHDNSANQSIPSTPSTLKQVEYCNLSVGVKPETVNSYANLSLGESGDSVKNIKNNSSPTDYNYKMFESDTFTSMSPVEELEVNYAVLDIDKKKDARIARDLTSLQSKSSKSSKKENVASFSKQIRTRLVSQCSIEKSTMASETVPTTNIGYTTIDFDKTVALTSVAADADVDADGPRKTRHNSCNILGGSPGSVDKTKTAN